MNTLSMLFDLSLIPGAVLSRLLYRGNSEGGKVSGWDTLFMVVTSYALYAYIASMIIQH